MCPEAQVNRTRSRTPRTHVNEENGDDGVEHEIKRMAVTVEYDS